jgi:hypothetical protein
MRLAMREIHITGIADLPEGARAIQDVRNLFDGFEGFLTGCRSLIRDLDPLFTAQVNPVLVSNGIESVPVAGTFAPSDCLRRTIRSIPQERVPGPDGVL